MEGKHDWGKITAKKDCISKTSLSWEGDSCFVTFTKLILIKDYITY